MNILLATFWAVPHVGGVWKYMVQLKKILEKSGHKVDLLGYGEDNTYIHLVNKGKKLSTDQLLPLLQTTITSDHYPEIYANELVKETEFQRYMYELAAAYFGLRKYDIIHTQDVISTVAISRIKPDTIPLVATLHGSVALEKYHQLETTHRSSTSSMAKEYFKNLEFLGAVSASTTIVANHWLRDILTNEFDVPLEQIQIQHYGYDVRSFLKEMKEKSSIKKPQDKKVITYTGRLVELKGVHHLLTALGQLKKERTEKDWVCWIIGDGDKMEELKTQAKMLMLSDDVFFFGKRQDIPYLLSLSDIHVLPSLLENQPLSVIEAQLAGRLVVVSNTGGLPEMVQHGVTGIVVPAGNPQALFRNLDLLLDSGKLRKKLGSNAKKWAMRHWSQKRAARALIKIYEQTKSEEGKDETNGTDFSVDI
ncbi:MAG: putative glycosyl transferase Family 4 [Neobacillus sp.]|nr:putative glycosyl transferase Family 4 [Neobacillus sp.]